MLDDKEKRAARAKIIALIVAFSLFIDGFILFYLQRNEFSSVDITSLLIGKPGVPLNITGFLLLALGVAVLLFRHQMGAWIAALVRWVSDFFLTGRGISARQEEKVERHLATRFNRKMVMAVAVMDICMGCFLIGLGCMLNASQ